MGPLSSLQIAVHLDHLNRGPFTAGRGTWPTRFCGQNCGHMLKTPARTGRPQDVGHVCEAPGFVKEECDRREWFDGVGELRHNM